MIKDRYFSYAYKVSRISKIIIARSWALKLRIGFYRLFTFRSERHRIIAAPYAYLLAVSWLKIEFISIMLVSCELSDRNIDQFESQGLTLTSRNRYLYCRWSRDYIHNTKFSSLIRYSIIVL